MASAGPILVADVGGTHVRIATATPSGLIDPLSLRVSDFDSLQGVILAYLHSAATAERPRRAAIAVAGPVTGDTVELTNQRWTLSIQELCNRIHLDEIEIVNDCRAHAAAVPALADADVHLMKEGVGVQGTPIGVIAPGTGLGVAALVAADDDWLALSTEGGHTDLPATGRLEWKVLEILQSRFGRVSRERVLSGPGLVNLYQALCEMAEDPPVLETPAQITDAALAGDERAIAVVRLFSGWLGAAAGDLALTLGARGGIYLAGGMLPKMRTALDIDHLVERFLAKGRFRGYLEPIPLHLILDPWTALRGAARILERKDPS